ncbi:MAG: hypothetical protein ACYTFY_04695 [Planctomycetota bacterium]
MGIEFGDIVVHDLLAAYRLADARDTIEAAEGRLSLAQYSARLNAAEAKEQLEKCSKYIYLLSEVIDMLIGENKLNEKDFFSALKLIEMDQSIEIWGN